MKLTLRAGDETREVRILRRGNHLAVTFDDGRTVEATLLTAGGGTFEIERDHARLHVVGAATGAEKRQIWINGRTLAYSRLQRAGAAAGAAAGDDSLAAAIPAVVVEVLVQPGDVVTVGQKLILLESMKMVIPIQAPHAGTVKAVHCQPGEAVQAGVPLVELEREG